MVRLRYVLREVKQGHISGKEPICQETGIALLKYVRRGTRQGHISGKEPNCQEKNGMAHLRYVRRGVREGYLLVRGAGGLVRQVPGRESCHTPIRDSFLRP